SSLASLDSALKNSYKLPSESQDTCSRTWEKTGVARLLLEQVRFSKNSSAWLRFESSDLFSMTWEPDFLLRVAIEREILGILARFQHIEEFESPRQQLQVPVE